MGLLQEHIPALRGFPGISHQKQPQMLWGDKEAAQDIFPT